MANILYTGAGIFVTTVVIGGVAFLTQFELTKRPFFRDIIFYTVAVYWTFYLLWTSTVTIYMATGILALWKTWAKCIHWTSRPAYCKILLEQLLAASFCYPLLCRVHSALRCLCSGGHCGKTCLPEVETGCNGTTAECIK